MGTTAKTEKKLIKLWPVLVIIGLVVAFAFPYWAKGRVPFPADHLVNAFPPWQYYYGLPVKNNAMPDVVTQMYPWKHLVINLWKQGQVPLWNPFNFSGNPFLANYQSAVFHPANWLFFLLPEIDAWSIMILLQPLLAGLFTYLFCQQLKLSRAASLLSSVAFMFSGFITVWLAYGTLSYALLWLPLLLFGIERGFSKPKWLIVVSFALAASFFSGHFQTSLYVLLAGLAYLLFKWRSTRQFKAFRLGLLFLILGIGLALIQILPTFELHQFSVRSQIFDISEIIPWQYLVTILAPDFYGNPVTRNDWFGHYAEWASFSGVIPFILAFYSMLNRAFLRRRHIFLKKRKSSVKFFTFLAILALLLTLSTPMLDLIMKLKIPVFSTSAASRIIGLFSFSIAVLAGFGLDQLKEDLAKNKLKFIFLACSIILLIFLLIWVNLLFFKPLEASQLSVAKRNLILPTGLAIVFSGLIIFFRLAKKFFENKKFIILSAILLLTILDLFRFSQKWMPFDSRERVYPSLSVLEFLTEKISHERLFGYFGMEMMNYYQIPGFNGYDPLYIQRYGELLMAANDGQIESPARREAKLERRGDQTLALLNLLGGKYYLHSFPDGRKDWVFPFWQYPEQFEQIYQDGVYEVFENKKASSRAFVVYEYDVSTEPQEIINLMFNNDLAKKVILEEEPLIELTLKPAKPTDISSVEIGKYSANRIDLQVKTEAPGLLFLSDNYYPGWQALVNNQPTKLYRADYSFRAIVIPKGEHRVEFIYKPESFKWGLWLSGLSLGMIIFFFLKNEIFFKH